MHILILKIYYIIKWSCVFFRGWSVNSVGCERSLFSSLDFNQPTNQPTMRSRVLLDKLIVTQPVKKLPTFYGTWMSITVFTRVRHWPLSWARWIQSTTSHPISLRSLLILYFHVRLGLSIGLFHSGFSTKIYTFHISPMHATSPAHLILLDFIKLLRCWFTHRRFPCTLRV